MQVLSGQLWEVEPCHGWGILGRGEAGPLTHLLSFCIPTCLDVSSCAPHRPLPGESLEKSGGVLGIVAEA